jgi:preprotein translocase subunit SecA
MRLFGGGRTKDLMQRVGMKPGEALNHPLLNRSIEKAQSRVEERNFEIRKHLLEYDDVVNEQRKFVYEQRDALLQDQDILQRVRGTAEQTVDSVVTELEEEKRDGRDAVMELLTRVKETLYFDPADRDRYLDMGLAAASAELKSAMASDLETKREAAGADAINRALRIEYLRTIDARWQEHLENLEALREAVSLRGYAQKNPLLEYKLEGFAIFDEMLGTIRSTIARLVFLVKPETLERQRAATQQPRQMQAQHRSFQLLGNQPQRQGRPAAARSGASRPGGPSGGGTATVVRSVPKVGRNDPCPCGSGKKYKHCHGA